MDETSQKTWLRKGRSQESAWGIQFLLLRPSFSWDGAHFLPSSWCSAVLDLGWQTCWHHADLWLLLSRAYTQSRTCQLLMLPCQGRGLGVPMTEPGQLTQVTKGTFFYHFTTSLYLFLQVSPFETVSSSYLVTRAIGCLKSKALLHSESTWGSLILHWATDTGKTSRRKDIKIW